MWKCRFESSKVSNTPSPSPKEPLQFFPNWIFQDTPSKPTILVSQWGLTKLPGLNEITMQDLASVVGQLHRQWNLQEHITNKRHTSLLGCFRSAMYEASILSLLAEASVGIRTAAVWAQILPAWLSTSDWLVYQLLLKWVRSSLDWSFRVDNVSTLGSMVELNAQNRCSMDPRPGFHLAWKCTFLYC